MKEIIVIRTSDPDGSVFHSIIRALQGKDVQILHAADLEPSSLTLGDIETVSYTHLGSAPSPAGPSRAEWRAVLRRLPPRPPGTGTPSGGSAHTPFHPGPL